jgi:hypothetical protein
MRHSLHGVCLAGILALIALVAGCGGTPANSTPSPGARIFTQARHGALRDAAFTIQFFADGQAQAGSGITTMRPQRMRLTLVRTTNGKTDTTIILADGDTLYALLSGETLWTVLNDPDIGIYVNYDTDIVNYDQMQAASAQLSDSVPLGGVPAWHLHARFTFPYIAPDGALVRVPGTEDLWLRQRDSFPLKIVKAATQPYTAVDGSQYTLTFRATYLFTGWNQGTTITPPSADQLGGGD